MSACVAPMRLSSSPSGCSSARSTSTGIKSAMAQPVVVDLRNIYRADDMAAHGFIYESVGRGVEPGI